MWFKMSFISIIILGIIACEINDKKNIRDFYFPLESLKEGKIYEFQSVHQDSLPPFYWHFQTIEENKGVFFISRYYDYNLNLQQYGKEEVVSNGTLLSDFFLYDKDTLGQIAQISVDIEVANVFPFQVTDSTGVFLFKINWTSPSQPDFKTRLIRNRRYIGKDTYLYNGTIYKSITMGIKELVETELDGFQEIEYTGKEIYAKGIGLVYFKKEIGSGLSLEYELKNIYDLVDFEEMTGTLLER